MCTLFTVAPTELSTAVRPLPRKFFFYDQLRFSSNSKQSKLLVRFLSAALDLSLRSFQKSVGCQRRAV